MPFLQFILEFLLFIIIIFNGISLIHLKKGAFKHDILASVSGSQENGLWFLVF